MLARYFHQFLMLGSSSNVPVKFSVKVFFIIFLHPLFTTEPVTPYFPKIPSPRAFHRPRHPGTPSPHHLITPTPAQRAPLFHQTALKIIKITSSLKQFQTVPVLFSQLCFAKGCSPTCLFRLMQIVLLISLYLLCICRIACNLLIHMKCYLNYDLAASCHKRSTEFSVLKTIFFQDAVITNQQNSKR